ncbi:hypothetical protein ACRE_072020 [Hapsidospora chrysogenum ATCC 11550]|uniref:Uncharacterized protein n=1 Tax=Hapsidospora chrysogenum (strain ATCC 11550 / CBS 779.69 / DSM 880 / IAM 14645 / JCM 23072 / IMI 49137) TaxID=857340 RepID=A0A086SY94_HAPC1|nr:hypothetical protein ACRE_072020 [Hapsidospora chrysogenum ATCC 11550]
MDRPSTPSRPPDYTLPPWRDDLDDFRDDDTPSGQNAAAVRLLTSVDGESTLDDSRSYVLFPEFNLTPLSLHRPPPSLPPPPPPPSPAQPPQPATSLPQAPSIERLRSVKLQKRKKQRGIASSVDPTQVLPSIPEGPSNRFREQRR